MLHIVMLHHAGADRGPGLLLRKMSTGPYSSGLQIPDLINGVSVVLWTAAQSAECSLYYDDLGTDERHFGSFGRCFQLPEGIDADKIEALISFGVNILELFRRAAEYVDNILRGATPADMPVESPAKFDLVINLATARVLGVTIPPTLLARVIDRRSFAALHMSFSGTKRTCQSLSAMSASGGKADNAANPLTREFALIPRSATRGLGSPPLHAACVRHPALAPRIVGEHPLMGGLQTK